MRGTGRLVCAAVAAMTLAIGIVPLGCGTDNQNDGPNPTPTPTSSGGATPTPTPVPTASVRVVDLVPRIGSNLSFDVGGGNRGFLVAWEDDTAPASSIRGLRLGADGTPIDDAFLVSVVQSAGYLGNPSWTSPAVGFDGSLYGVVYAGTGTVQGSIPGAAITAVQVGTDGSVGLPADLAETAQIGTCESSVVPPPAIAGSSATSFAAIWPLEEGCAGGPVLDRLDGAFAVVQSQGFAVSEIDGLLPPVGDETVVSSAAAVASSGATTFGAWTEMAEGSTAVNVEVAALTTGGAQRALLASAGGGLVRPAIASDGSDYLVVWQSAPSTISGARFRPGTRPLDGASGFVIAQAAGKTLGEPRVAFADGRYLVAWTANPGEAGTIGNPDLRAVEVTPQGAVGTAQTLVANIDWTGIALAASNGTFVIPFVSDASAGSAASFTLKAVVFRP